MPLVEPGMKTVFPEMFMLRVWPARPRRGQRPVIGGSAIPGSRRGRRPIMDTWTVQHWPTSCAAAARRCGPGTSGCPPGARRRAPGLRREEVAALAAMSTDYYTRLEQQRGPQPSEQMLASLARALRLTGDERDYLFRVAGRNRRRRSRPRRTSPPALLRVLDRLDDTPALILSEPGRDARAEPDGGGPVRRPRRATRAWPAARSTGGSPTPPSGCATPRTTATGRAAPRSPTCAPPTGRWARGRGPASSCGPCSKASPEFAELWERHEVAKRFEDHKTCSTPSSARSRWTARCCSPRTSRRRCSCSPPPPRTEGYEKLQLLAVLGRQRFTDAEIS